MIAPLGLYSDTDLDYVELVFLLTLANGFAVIFHLPFVRFRREHFVILRSPQNIFSVGLAGLLISGSYIIVTYAASISSDASLPAIIFEIYPLLLVLTSSVILQRRIKTRDIAAILILTLMYVYAATLTSSDFELSGNISILISIASAILLAVGMSFTSKLSVQLSAASIINPSAFASMLTRLSAFFIYGIIAFCFEVDFPDYSTLLFAALYGLLILTFANIFYYKSVEINADPLINSIGMISPMVTLVYLYSFDLIVLSGSNIFLSIFGFAILALYFIKVHK